MKTTKYLFSLFSISIVTLQFCFGQVTFQKAYGGSNFDEGYAVIQTFDGGYAITGCTESYGMGYTDVYLIRTNANGDTLWTKTFGTTGQDEGTSIKQSFDGSFIISGYSKLLSARSRCYLIKTDSTGNLVWSKTYEGTKHAYGNEVNITNDNGIIIAGYVDTSASDENAYLIRTDEFGDTLWTKAYKIPGINSTMAYEAKETIDGGFIVTGSAKDLITVNPNVLLFKTDSLGSIIWSKTFGGSGYDFGYAIALTTDGGYIITGSTLSWGAGSTDLYLIKTDSLGNLQWSKAYGDHGFDFGLSVKQTQDNGYIVGGYYTNWNTSVEKAYLLKTDSIGNLIWSKVYGGNGHNYGYSVQPTFDNGYIFVGSSYNLGAGNYDVYLIKTDSNGVSGCYDTIPSITVTITSTNQYNSSLYAVEGGTLQLPSTVQGSGGTVSTICTSVGIGEMFHQKTHTLSPNPTTGNFTITFPSTINKGTITVTNTMGAKVFSQNIINATTANIQLKNFANGIYFVEINTTKGILMKKVVVGK